MLLSKKIELTIKRFDKNLPLPDYQTAGAVAFDLCARVDTYIASHEVGYVPLNIALELPEGYWALVTARSSLHKRGLMMANGVGVGDWDYRGDGDEYKAALFNFSDSEVLIKKGERLVQMLILPYERVSFVEKNRLESKERGGFGTTGR